MKLCPKCNNSKNENEFNKNSLRKDGLQRICRECTKKEHKKYWNKNGKSQIHKRTKVNKDFYNTIREDKGKQGCKKCNESRYWLLDYHHINPNEKNFSIATGVIKYGKTKVLKEITKCIILCKNCHSDFHHLEKTNNITIKEYLK